MDESPSPTRTEVSRSVIICAYTEDRWERLCQAVESAAQQLAEGDDLIVVIDYNESLLVRASTAFSEIATVVANRLERGLSGARNTGVDEASGTLAIFLDDDAAAGPNWLDALTAPFADEAVVGVGGAAEPDWDGGNRPWWMPEEFFWVIGCSYRGLPTGVAEIRNPIGCNMAFRAEAIRQAGGFSADLGRVQQKPIGGEETDLAIRIRTATSGRVLYEPSAIVHHAVEAPRQRFSYFSRRCYWEGRSKAVLARRVGTSEATASERAYLVTLVTGVALRIGRAVRLRSLAPIGQVFSLAYGTLATGFGFLVGSVAGRSELRSNDHSR